MNKKLNWFERTMGFVMPSFGKKTRGYDAALTPPPRNAQRNMASREANSSVVGSVALKARHAVQNNPFARKGLETLVNSTISWGIEAYISGAKNQKRVGDLWLQWKKSCSVLGENFEQVQTQVFSTLLVDGEVLIRLHKIDGAVKLQVLECDVLSTRTIKDIPEGSTFSNGILKDKFGKPTYYYLTKANSKEIEVVPANEIIHVFRKVRPEQDRGVSYFVNVLEALSNLDELLYTQMMRLKLSASLTAVVSGSNTVGDPTNIQKLREEMWELNPNTVHYLNVGETVEFPNVPNPDGFSETMKMTLRQIAMGLVITYESLSGDLNGVNYSSARVGDIQFRANVESLRWNLFIPMFLDKVFEQAFKVHCGLNGVDTTGTIVEWVPPQRLLQDPQAEITATKEAIRNGLMSYQGALRELGYNPKLLVKEIADSNKMLDEAGLILDSDPRRSSNGQLVSSENLQAVQADINKNKE